MPRSRSNPEVWESLEVARDRSLSARWLIEGHYDDDVWVVVDDLPTSPKPAMKIRWNVQLFDPRHPGEICRLTDPQYADMLDTIKRQSMALRAGKYACVSSAVCHEDMTRNLINWALWMIGNSIYRFADLTEDDFEAYVEAARFGPGFLLGFAPRLAKFVDELKASGTELPSVKRDRVALRTLNAVKLLEAAGIDPRKGRVDDATTYKLAEISANEGFSLTVSQIERLEKELPSPRLLSDIGITRAIQTWAQQWLLRNELPGDHIRFNPFEDYSVRQLANEKCAKGGRTKTAPVQQTMELINSSIYWVLDYASILLDLRDHFLTLAVTGMNPRKRRQMLAKIKQTHIPEGMGRPFPLNANSLKHKTDGLELGVAVNRYLPTACAVVICAFTGRRHEEVLSARAVGPKNASCITQDEEGFWLELFIEKTCQDWVKTPCNELVVAAIRVLERWSEPARSATERSNLFQLRRLTSKPVFRFYLGDSLKEFVSFLKLTPMSDGSEWIFTPHQFRRFFAIMYYWRYQYRNLGALSYQLRHLDPAMTQVYVTERETGEIFKDVGKEHTVVLLTETAIGSRNLSGPFGERVKGVVRKLCLRFSKTTKVVSANLVRRVVDRYVTRTGRRLKGMPWGYCACGSRPHELSKARCLSGKDPKKSVAPDFSNSSPVVCCNCPHHATENLFEPFLREEIEFHERAAADRKNGPILRTASREHVKVLRTHYKKSFRCAESV